MGELQGHGGEGVLVSRDGLAWLDDVLRGAPDAEAFVRTTLGPLIDYDARHHGDLVHTVEVLAACGWSASRAARRLFLLRNSVLYRRARIEEILGCRLEDPEQRLLLTVATRLHRHSNPSHQEA
jgi:DNA-binding PucR family transcriptional regulator